jgi:hypothetical protein
VVGIAEGDFAAAHAAAHAAAEDGIRLARSAGAGTLVHRLRHWRLMAAIALGRLDDALAESTALVAQLRELLICRIRH